VLQLAVVYVLAATMSDGIPGDRLQQFLLLTVGALAGTAMGLVISAFATFLISALGTHETRWKETIIVGIALTAFCSFLFPYGLGLPMQLWPRFLVQ